MWPSQGIGNFKRDGRQEYVNKTEIYEIRILQGMPDPFTAQALCIGHQAGSGAV
jgi:hypothetical protein